MLDFKIENVRFIRAWRTTIHIPKLNDIIFQIDKNCDAKKKIDGSNLCLMPGTPTIIPITMLKLLGPIC